MSGRTILDNPVFVYLLPGVTAPERRIFQRFVAAYQHENDAHSITCYDLAEWDASVHSFTPEEIDEFESILSELIAKYG